MRIILALILWCAWHPARAGFLDVWPSQQCQTAIAAAEAGAGVPAGLMHAIGAMESGRRDKSGRVVAWPWTINAEGAGSYFATKGEAIAAVLALQARGIRSIDVGCMQVNLMHHSAAFPTLNDAFDPAANARYAASFLQRLLAQTGSWPAATAGYHSLTPEHGEPYARKVLAIWRGAGGVPPVAAPASSSVSMPGGGMLTAGAGHGMGLGNPGARIIRQTELAGGTTVMLAGGTVGRGLDAYRSAPINLATRLVMPFRGRG